MSLTWADIVARGGGTAEFRVVIEGSPLVFCTAGMTFGTSPADSGAERIGGLLRESLGFTESCYFAGAEQNVSISPVQIADEGIGANRGKATWLFSTIARVIDYLQGDVSDTDGTLTVRDSGSLVGHYGWLATETVFFDGVLTGTTVDTSRAQLRSVGQYHYVNPGSRPSVTPIYDHPPGFVSRRVWLYAHGAGETGLYDSGTIIWRGIVDKEPSESQGVWTLQASPRTKLLDGSIAAGFDALKMRGAYYPGSHPLQLLVLRSSGAALDLASTDSFQFLLSGFFGTQSAFCQALTDGLNADATAVAWGVSFEAREVGDGGWDLYLRTPTGAARYISVLFGSAVDGLFKGTLELEYFAALRDGVSSGSETETVYDVTTVTADTIYRVRRYSGDYGMPGPDAGRFDGASLRQVPRGNYSNVTWPGRDAEEATHPTRRLYLASVADLTTADSLFLTPVGEDATPELLWISSVNTVNGYVDAASGGFGYGAPPQALGAGEKQPTITGLQTYASGDGSLEDFRADMVSRSAALANRGKAPHLTTDDVASWSSAVAEAAGGAAWALHRNYSFGKGVRAIEVFKEEWKLLGLIPYLDADFKLAVRPLTFETRDPEWEVDSQHRVIDDGFGSVAGDDDGLVTAVKIHVGYDPAEDKQIGDTFDVRNLGAIARVKKEARLEIEPKSNAVGAEMTWDDAYSRAMGITEIFGARRTQTVQFDVSLKLFDMRIGDQLAITIPQLPGDGARGIWSPGQGLASRTGYLVSRSWELANGRGTVRVLVHDLAGSPGEGYAAYSPSGHVIGATGAGTIWWLNLDPGRYSGTNDSSFFAVGDKIRIYQFDATSPTVLAGTVLTLDTAGEKVEVSLASAWAGLGGSEYMLMFDASNSGATADQLVYAYVASGASGRIVTASGSLPSRVLAP